MFYENRQIRNKYLVKGFKKDLSLWTKKLEVMNDFNCITENNL